MTNIKVRKVVSFSLPQKDQMDRLIDAVCPPPEKGNYLEWSINEETGELELYEEDTEESDTGRNHQKKA